jgi:hypothetical protein
MNEFLQILGDIELLKQKLYSVNSTSFEVLFLNISLCKRSTDIVLFRFERFTSWLLTSLIVIWQFKDSEATSLIGSQDGFDWPIFY